ncbi:uncharacterized protein B0P05DRAFT_575021 [Gilbertella persicaria]|uniref:uncharacterized protein n=1 Tax=Gilbertella persicaria TaxID=101096 RepID=UPI00221F7E03|nr:uncharacterized protein B0P05DRAFT_575021 [Gilbertella persicaria]KAI8058952.1 hypothetical protein B0P05DRAFT_575021 [Gilbertella persicaria]
MISSQENTESLYFLKLDDLSHQSLAITFGLFSYCVQENDKIQRSVNDAVMTVPFEFEVIHLLNSTYPQLFADQNTIDTDLNSGGEETVPHDPKMYAAFVLCLMSSGTCLALSIYKFLERNKVHGYQDIYFSRGFLTLSAALLALLLITLSSTMY